MSACTGEQASYKAASAGSRLLAQLLGPESCACKSHLLPSLCTWSATRLLVMQVYVATSRQGVLGRLEFEDALREDARGVVRSLKRQVSLFCTELSLIHDALRECRGASCPACCARISCLRLLRVWQCLPGGCLQPAVPSQPLAGRMKAQNV